MTEQSPAEAIFFSALAKSTPEERAAFLDAACGDDAALRRRVERLLEAHSRAGDFLEPPAGEPTAVYFPCGEKPGTVIAGRYKLLEQIGEGGMGVVWVADQFEPVRRRLALKVIKPGMDSRAVLARFEAERQALALMDHPNIARVLDAGTSDDGRPYFVMELVKGVPITEFCDARRLTPRERLELFVPVCQAIQHAHQKGIIHRDIKPSNVLVALHDEKPVPKVIDFGVAKAVGGQLTEKTVYTRYGTLVGTPAYMAPEQATFNQLDIDTRTDVYALGVLLYELLAGSTPLEPDRLKRAAFDEMLRLLREEEPPRPSLRLSTSQTRASVAAVRSSDPDKLSRLMRGELDWIVMKALEKDRNRRYETPTGLAADVQRYLTGEAVQAHPPSRTYRLRKFVRKHRVMLTTAAAFAALLLAAAAISSWLAVEARRAEKLAEERRKEADEQRNEAIDQNHLAVSTKFALYGHLVNLVSKNREVERLKNNLQVDADLAELENRPAVGLLRLCRTLKNLPGKHVEDPTFIIPGAKFGETEEYRTGWNPDDPRRQELREFVTAAILAGGQEYASLLPPITHDGQEVLDCWFTPDRRTLLTYGKDATARLWDVRSARQIAILRKGDEKVVNCGFSPDGRTVFTDDESSLARLWDVPLGTFRAEIAPRPHRYEHLPDSVSQHWGRAWSDGSPSDVLPFPAAQISDRYLLTWSAREQIPSGHSYLGPDPFIGGPVELWDTATGQFAARLNVPADAIAGDFQLQSGGRWVTAVCFAERTEIVEDAEGAPSQDVVVYDPIGILVFSTADGRLVRRLPFPDATQIWSVAASPTGRRIATIVASRNTPPRLWVWDTASWRTDSADMPEDLTWSSIKFLTEDLFLAAILPQDQIMIGSSIRVYRFRDDHLPAKADAVFDYEPTFLLPAGKLALLGSEVYETDTEPWRRLLPPPGRKFHPALADFAPGGRFIPSPVTWDGMVDIKTDKFFATPAFLMQLSPRGGTSAIEFVAVYDWSYYAHYGVELRFLPSADHLHLPPDLLELWAQVTVRGELAPDGSFVKWEEPIWEKKRQELAAKPTPDPDLPFPGHVVTDRLHWLRAEYGAATSEDEKLDLAKELLRRAEDMGDKPEAVHWRNTILEIEAKQNPPSQADP